MGRSRGSSAALAGAAASLGSTHVQPHITSAHGKAPPATHVYRRGPPLLMCTLTPGCGGTAVSRNCRGGGQAQQQMPLRWTQELASWHACCAPPCLPVAPECSSVSMLGTNQQMLHLL